MSTQNPPSGGADEKEADRLIAAFGKKPAPDQERKLMEFLKSQKEKFVENDRDRVKENERGQQR